jgi:predicted ArsR family transcriptional regulator
MFTVGDSGKVPFEDAMLEYIRTHPEGTYADAARDLGISVAAVAIACAQLTAKGLAHYEDSE